jgi:retron-type reverse transcriptase
MRYAASDADIRAFFDEIDHEWMLRFLAHRIADQRIIRLIRKWLTAGTIESGKRTASVRGTPQGSVISPLLANIYLHYAFDLWAHQWRNRHAAGDVILIRYADDSVVGFQYENEAKRFLAAMCERFAQFKLELHPDKTVAVGTMVTHRPPHRSVLAELPHTAPATGFDVKPF